MIISFAFPSRGITDPAFAVALKLLQIPQPDFDRFEVLNVSGADAAESRNILASRAKGDYILFLDDDVLPPPDAIIKLFSHKKDIVSGLYFARQEPYFPQIFKKNREDSRRNDSIGDYPKDELTEVDSCGAGCLLIKREVFKKIKKPYFQYIPRGENTPRIGEDMFFCEKARKAGYKIYCDTSVICRHISTKLITPDYWEVSKARIEEIKNKLGEKKFNEFKKKFYD